LNRGAGHAHLAELRPLTGMNHDVDKADTFQADMSDFTHNVEKLQS
jgi:hypothetical protein